MEIRHVDWLPAPGVNTQGVVAALVRQAQQPQSSLGTAYSADGVTRYTYDPTGQLVAAQYSACATGSASAVLPDETYTYDANGNRTMPGYVIGEGNRLLSDGTYQYAYDAEGNRTARFIDANANGLLDEGDNTITVYGWDGRNRLASVTTYATFGGPATQIVGYRYDTQNRWIGETIDADGDGTIDHATRFAYDGHQIALQFDKACATGSASALTAADLSHRYLWGPAVDQLLSDERTHLDGAGTLATDDLLWALGDQLGTVRDLAICDAATGVTSVANHRDFDSFGNLKAQANAAVDCLIGFTGLPFDAGSGTYRTPTRPYDPATGRWLQPDWIDVAGRDTNLYRYCANSPTNATDPSGLEKKQGWVVNYIGKCAPGDQVQIRHKGRSASIQLTVGAEIVDRKGHDSNPNGWRTIGLLASKLNGDSQAYSWIQFYQTRFIGIDADGIQYAIAATYDVNAPGVWGGDHKEDTWHWYIDAQKETGPWYCGVTVRKDDSLGIYDSPSAVTHTRPLSITKEDINFPRMAKLIESVEKQMKATNMPAPVTLIVEQVFEAYLVKATTPSDTNDLLSPIATVAWKMVEEMKVKNLYRTAKGTLGMNLTFQPERYHWRSLDEQMQVQHHRLRDSQLQELAKWFPAYVK